jgi:hypothetical protein
MASNRIVLFMTALVLALMSTGRALPRAAQGCSDSQGRWYDDGARGSLNGSCVKCNAGQWVKRPAEECAQCLVPGRIPAASRVASISEGNPRDCIYAGQWFKDGTFSKNGSSCQMCNEGIWVDRNCDDCNVGKRATSTKYDTRWSRLDSSGKPRYLEFQTSAAELSATKGLYRLTASDARIYRVQYLPGPQSTCDKDLSGEMTIAADQKGFSWLDRVAGSRCFEKYRVYYEIQERICVAGC